MQAGVQVVAAAMQQVFRCRVCSPLFAPAAITHKMHRPLWPVNMKRFRVCGLAVVGGVCSYPGEMHDVHMVRQVVHLRHAPAAAGQQFAGSVGRQQGGLLLQLPV